MLNPLSYTGRAEIFYFNKRAILNNDVDGKVRVHRPHRVMKAQSYTLDHVLHMTAHSVNSGQFLSITPPFVNPEPLLFLSQETEFYIDVVEVPLQDASGALHNDCVSLQSDVHIFWNVDSLIAENGLHPLSRCGKEIMSVVSEKRDVRCMTDMPLGIENGDWSLFLFLTGQ
uniref:Uncharacterized protein n=1 Tax=Molossus molossus TaxID=27622 RepID=A0A7J8JVD4_MOLMO|nr:hypothetical protein HJG59_007844 [Molossus molossus]